MHITGTHFNYYMVCHRNLWLFANDMQMEHTSGLFDMGKLIHETSYPNLHKTDEVLLTDLDR